MTPQQYLDAITADSDRFSAATSASLATPVGFLGEWKVHDLVAHLGGVYAVVAANTANPTTEWVKPGDEAKAPEGDAINDWFLDRRTAVLDALSSGHVDDPAWTFAGAKSTGWWLRRMAHETAVHRCDAQIATLDGQAEIDSALAADGIDEYTEVGLRSSSSRPNRTYPEQTLHLHRTDGPGEWMFARADDGSVVVTQEHGKGDAAVRGPASALLLWIWGRPVEGLEVFGDPAVARAWQAVAP